ncbi:fatty acid synthase alpha subunit Lsd1 [Coemansia guatemalensis]|uniref:Fatty acid synthase alpha subunit Lsd1 n=1 Tax=Coemansia guatemalensis TaxID=2761395 RepID=A0A9W8HYW2_9FUNG|nr:fatty acid synthase alpha subunit Lsd1 [Coemansia guatemalensis]
MTRDEMLPNAAEVVVAGLRLPHNIAIATQPIFSRFLLKVDQTIDYDKDQRITEKSNDAVTAANFAAYTWEEDVDIAIAVFEAFESKYCSDQDIHVYVCDSKLDVDQTESVLRAYYAAKSKYCKVKGASKTPVARPALFSTGNFRIMAVFAGQGGMDNYMDETRSVFSIYQPLVEDYVVCMSEHLKKEAAEPELARIYRNGLDALRWIKSPEETPSQEYMISVPVCLPLVGLTQLMQVMVLYKSLGISPGELADKFEYVTGHSQGIVAAAVLALVTDEESFYKVSKVALGLLMLGGFFPQQDYPMTKPSAAFNDSAPPTPMARVLNLTRSQLESAIARYNQQHRHLESSKIYLSLTNSARMHVVSGNTASLSSFVQLLKQEFDTNGADQTRIPFSKRKPGVSIKYLSINGPYHCELLAHALEGACAYATKKEWFMDGNSLRRPVKTYEDGRDIYGIQDLAHYLLRCMFVIPVDWPAAAKIPGITHVVDFGPGGVSGIGALMHRIYEGEGVSVICAGALNSNGSPLAIKADLYRTDARTLATFSDWASEYRPRLVRCASDGSIHIDTPMSRLLGKPPVMVAGMTPSTVSEVFVSAVIRAGYHIELSGGGHFSESMLRDKADKILALVGPGSNITINSIYVNPFLWNIQYPAIKAMRREGIPMDGLCIGAGVPSFDVCNEIISSIREVGFRHIGLKPSSVATIRLVIKIAQANPGFPVLLQWTGGRAGGHHSFEDFHQPILQTYGAIRAQKNIVLIAGSGFGGVDDTLPYLTGDWSRRFDCAPMPFDGCLFASRVMVAKEGAASDAVKEAIVAAPGIEDSEWEKTYNGPAGGIVTVLSEMGEPIHKIATRGVMLWKELDDTVFSLPRDKRLPALMAKKDYIIRRLNDDFQKPWFGKKADGTTADLEEMTYAEVANRLVEVLYVAHQSRWIDVTMRNLVGDYLLRLEERFASADGPAILQSFEQINSPYEQIAAILDAYPECRSQLLASEDIQFFINLCMRPGQKPVPFIPLMDKDFHIWFKKDSLWQAEDVDAVAGQDVGRVCILQGPVAVRYSTKANEPVKDILDNIYNGQIAALLERYYDGDETNVPVVGYLGATHTKRAVPPHVRVEISEKERVYTLPRSQSQLPEPEAWLETLAGSELTWLRAFLTTPIVAQDRRYTNNIAQRVLRPRPSQVVRVSMQDGRPRAVEIIDASGTKALDFEISVDNMIRFNMYSSPRGAVCTLELLFRYEAAMPYAPIHEVMEGRNDRIKRFYAQVWFEDSDDAMAIIAGKSPATFFKGTMLTASRADIEDFCYAIGNISDRYIAAGGAATIAPLDYAVRIFWPALCKCLMSPVCDGDLTSLVHLSNEFRVVPGAQPIRPDEQLTSEAQITEVLDSASGRTVRVKGHVIRASQPVIAIDTSFFFRNHLPDYVSNFKHVSEKPFQLEVRDMSLLMLVQSREWLVSVEEMKNPISLGDTLQFHLESRYRFNSAMVYSHIVTYGTVLARRSTSDYVKVAHVDFECGTTSANPVLQFLRRHGQLVSNTSELDADGRDLVGVHQKDESVVLAPLSNQAYSDASTDRNPIHTSEYFSDLVQLPATITHGMWTSAAARRAIERIVADGCAERVVAYNVSFVDMVCPGDQLETRINHTGFADGRLLLRVQSYVHGTKVLEGTAEVEQPKTAFTFTGQGAHVPGMGMDLYASSKVARNVWDSADTFMRNAYGIPLVDIVRNNPQSYTVHFVGQRGTKVRDNYRAMVYEYSERDGSRLIARPLFPDIFESTESFTFYSERGLLYATQFTQAAMLICEVAEFAHLRAAGVVPEHAAYAGHSLGEYAGLTAIGGVFTPEAAADIGFCRGLTMQQSVRRDAQNRSIYGMVAVSIARVGAWFTLEDLTATVAAIKDYGGYDGLLEIVNYNVRGMQYVASGELVLLDALGLMLASISEAKHIPKELALLAKHSVQQALTRKAGDPHYELHRTSATIPIPGIDVPFHSSLLKDGVWSFRKMLQTKIKRQHVSVDKLCGRYIPNLTARPFQVSEEYIRDVMELTDSAPLAELLGTLDNIRLERDSNYKQHVAYVLLIEVLCHQFSSPVRWIETQDVLLCDLGILRFIEIGPSNVMSNMLRRTLSSPSYIQSGRSASLMPRMEVLCSASDMDKILYRDAGAALEADKPDDTGTLSESANRPAAPVHQTQPDAPTEAAAADAAVEISSSVGTSSGGAMSIPDVAIQPIEVIRALVAHKLKLGLESVTGDKTIQDLVGGKSTLQNEIIGDLQKEFGGEPPDKPEEIPLSELAQGLSLPADGLGKVSQGLISRMIASKMPGGYTRSSICQHLEEAFGLGKKRQQGMLLVALTMEPPVRLETESGARDWLATVAKRYASISGISFATSPASTAGTGRGAGAAVVINSAVFSAAQKAQHQLAKRTIHALAAYLDIDIDQATGGSAATAENSTLAQTASNLDIWNAEYGQEFCEGIQPAFSAPMARLYDSYWNWARQDIMELYFDIVSGKIAKVDLSISSHCLRLMNRITPSLMVVLEHVLQRSEQGSSLAQLLAKKHGANLVKQCTLALNVSPAYQFTGRLLAPRLRIDSRGELVYFEIERPGEESVRDYADVVLSSSKVDSVRDCTADTSLYAMIRKLGLSLPECEARPQRALPPMVHLKSKAADLTNWSYDKEKSNILVSIFHDICDNGLSLAGKRALVTGCGRGSIGAEVLRGLLEGGAHVVATTSSYSANTTRYFQELYQKHGSRGSSLTVVPFNQASKQDVSRLVEYIYDGGSRGKGLGWDLDYVIPFAAIPELGHDLTELDSRSELAHRAMLTNVMRLLGEIASQKAKRRLDMHPTLVVLPLSPNHGTFGYDGHYSESKIGLETLMNRWHAEPTWGSYISVAGAVIGWTRGTGLMSGNNMVAEWVERTGVRTFTAAEMAFNILALLHPRAYALAAMEPIWADMGGRFQYYPNLTNSIIALRQALTQMRDARKAAAADSLADFGGVADKNIERVYQLHTISKRANHRFSFPKIKSYEELAHLHHLQGMVNLDQVVVVTGYGEVGPYGNAETRWEMEAFGEFSLEGCIELAWIMGLIKHFNGKHKKSGKFYTGWVDAQTEEPVADKRVKSQYEKQILEHTGIRLIEPEGIYGYDPSKKPMMRELQIEHDMEPFEASEEEAHQFKLRNGDKVSIWQSQAKGSDSWMVRFLKGATLMVPKALRVDRLVAAQLPTGWDPVRYGIPKSIADQIDPISCYALVATVEALLRSGITDPYEIYKYVHVSEVGSSTGSAVGGLRSTKSVFGERLCDKAQQPDVYQEVFLSTPPAWINMLLMSASGPIKTTIGACATGIASIDVAVDTIQTGKAKIMLAGGTDSICEESSYEFAQMNATSSTLSEFEQGRTPREMSRPCTTTRNGFMESEGAGVVTLMSAATAIEMGAPIHGIVAMTGTATDKEGRSVPAPGKGVLTSAREAPCGPAKAQLLEIGYRRRQLELRQRQIHEWAAEEREQIMQIARTPRQDCLKSEDDAVDSQLEFVASERKRQIDEALTMWGNSFWKRNPSISPLRGSLAVWGLTVDDIGIASFHGTSTKANDKNESEIVEKQLRHLGRTPGNVVFSICQKYLTGHPKGPASIWMLNGALQVLRTGIVPGNRNADNIAAELEKLEYIVYPSRSIQTPGIKAALIKSFGFGQVGAECLMVHPDYLLAVLDREQLEQYRARNTQREAHAYRYWHNVLTDAHPFVQVKTAPPYTAEEEEQMYLNPLGRM